MRDEFFACAVTCSVYLILTVVGYVPPLSGTCRGREVTCMCTRVVAHSRESSGSTRVVVRLRATRGLRRVSQTESPLVVGRGHSVSRPCVAGGARATTCTVRAADVFPAGAWPPSSSASAVVSSSRACTRALDTVRTASSLLPNTPLGPQPDAHSELVWQVAMADDCARCLRQVLHLR